MSAYTDYAPILGRYIINDSLRTDLTTMESGVGNGSAIQLIQLFIVIFAGFATLLWRIYETDVEEMQSGSPEILAWLFMSISVMPIYPAFLLSLILLTRGGSVLTEYIAYLLGIFITIPILILTSINLHVGVMNSEDIEFSPYQRAIICVSTIVVWASLLAIVAWHLSPGALDSILNCYQ